MSHKNNTVLLISYYFPPETNGGAARAGSIYHYLRQQGFNVIVITNDRESNIGCYDEILRVRCWRSRGILGVIARTLGYLINRCGIFIGEDLCWKSGVKSKVKSLKTNIDIVYSSYPGIDTLLAGMSAANLLNTEYISEFRDGLGFEPHVQMNSLQKIGGQWLEKKIIERSSKVICATNSISKYFEEKYNSNNIFTIFNGYNNNDIDTGYIPNTKTDHRTSIIHIGRIAGSRKRSIKPLVSALHELFQSKIITKENFQLFFLGALTDEELNLLNPLIKFGVVQHKNTVAKKQAFLIAIDFKYLLFYGIPNEKSLISSKLLEYLMLNKPVLGICQGNEAASIIIDTGVGEVVGFEVKEIKHLLMKALDGKIEFNPLHDRIRFYDRSHQIKLLGQILTN